MQKIGEFRIDILGIVGPNGPQPCGVSVSGPIQDEIITYWALEKAMDAVKEAHRKMNAEAGKPQLALPNGPLPNLRG